MFLFLPAICQSHTNLLLVLTDFWRVISERIHKRKMNPHFKAQRHVSEMLCRSSSAHTKLNGHFPFCTNDLYRFSTASHSQTPWKNPLGYRRIWCYQTVFSENLTRSTHSRYSGASLERESQGSLWYKMEFLEMTSWLQKILGKWRLNHLLTKRLQIFTFSEVVKTSELVIPPIAEGNDPS